jgi:hypothetical protein
MMISDVTIIVAVAMVHDVDSKRSPVSDNMISYINHWMGISWYVPSGSLRLMEIGKIPDSSSWIAISTGSINLACNSISIGAPIEICNARAPTILALSKRVNFGGPIRILGSGSLIVDTFPIHPFSQKSKLNKN